MVNDVNGAPQVSVVGCQNHKRHWPSSFPSPPKVGIKPAQIIIIKAMTVNIQLKPNYFCQFGE